MIAALIWILAALIATGLWWKVRGAGFRRLIVALSLISLVATGATAAYVWRSSEAAALAAAERAEIARRDFAAARSDTDTARRTSELRRTMENADAALGAFFGGGTYVPRSRGPDETVIAAEGAAVAAQSELTRAERDASSQEQGWAAIGPVLTWAGFSYLLLIVGVGLVIWVTAGFSPRAMSALQTPISGELSTKPASIKGKLSKVPPILLAGLAIVTVLSVSGIAWFVIDARAPRISPETEDASRAATLAPAAPVMPTLPGSMTDSQTRKATTEATPASAAAPQPEAPTFTPTRRWLAGWWSQDGFCEGDAGETFVADGGWGEWGTNGRWTLDGNVLTVTKTTRIRDTASGGPEEIDPREQLRGRLTNADANSFNWRGTRMVRCEAT